MYFIDVNKIHQYCQCKIAMGNAITFALPKNANV